MGEESFLFSIKLLIATAALIRHFVVINDARLVHVLLNGSHYILMISYCFILKRTM